MSARLVTMSGSLRSVADATLKLFRSRSLPLAALGAAVGLAASSAAAQQAIVQPGYAVVTGYSGYVSSTPPSGAGDPFDYALTNVNGPSARVVDLSAMSGQGTVTDAPKPFTVYAGQVGQVFGVALDDAQAPNIYLAATSAYGLSIYVNDPSGQPKRVHVGAPGAQFVPGQFGPQDQNGGPGSIWRVDGVTGQVTLFANIDGGVGSVSGLGALAFDRQSHQLLVSERGTGIVYRLGLNGAVLGTYDHGTEGRPSAGLGPMALSPSAPVNIQSPSFDTGNPQTWGIAPPARRVYALAVYGGRLYYSVAEGPRIWSAPIAGGAISGAGARIEVDVPSLADGEEVSSIAFDGQGDMYLAERGATTGDYDLTQLANPSQSRVLRFVPKQPGDPSPGFWRAAPDQYSVGLPPAYANANGGVALNYGYGYDGRINPAACGATLWSTGERLLDPGDGSTGFPTVDGLQGNDTSLFQPQNTPPTQSWFVDYDDQPGDPNFRGYMGAIATVPCGGTAYVPPPVYCPPGTYFANGQCVLLPTCPVGTYLRDGACIYPNCPPGTYRDRDNRCVPPPQSCPRDSFYYQGRCVPFCPPEMRRLPNGYCGCPDGTFYSERERRCVPSNSCPPRTHFDPRSQACVPDCRPGEQYDWRRGVCVPPCLQGWLFNFDHKRCEPPSCPRGSQFNPDRRRCEPICPPNQRYDVQTNSCGPKCPPGITRLPGCGPTPPICLQGTQYNQDRHRCEPICNPDQRYDVQSNKCVLKCLPGSRLPGCGQPNQPPGLPGQTGGTCDPTHFDKIGDRCLPKCPAGQVRNPKTLQCLSDTLREKPIINPTIQIPKCSPREDLINGQCVPKCPPGLTRVNGQCVGSNPPNNFKPANNGIPLGKPICGPNQELVGGRCVERCGSNQFRARNGACVDKNANDNNPPRILKIQ